LLAYDVVGGKDVARAVPLAAAVELLHTASLVHDDINDHSNMRRGRATVNAQWGNGLALLVGDFVFVRLLNLISTLDARAMQVLSDCCTAIVEGETLQMLHLGNTAMTEETYFRIVGLKTAALFSACGELGGLLGGGEEDQIRALKDYGYNVGVAFQIRDDTLDLVGESEKLGKPVASDQDQGKMSLATLFALEGSKQAKELLFSGDSAETTRLLCGSGAVEYAMQKAKEYSERAKGALSILSGSEAKEKLLKLADFALVRDQ
jgi:geranylgeranyl pyrophosphate synthase